MMQNGPQQYATHPLEATSTNGELAMTATTNPNKALWEKGDFARIAASMRESGEALVRDLGISEGLKVLGLGCGDGTTAVPAAQLGAEVLGVDIAGNLVAAGNQRAQDLGLSNLRFQEGDATDHEDLADESFDLVISVFGAMFAPKPPDVAREMVRVTKPGGEANLQAELDALFNEQNTADDGTTSIPATFLRVTVER
jgi:ubiquinone/menaquinone biosynthesis C-methylase UbiE